MKIEKFKEITRTAKKDAVITLANLGIEDDFRIRVMDRPQYEYLGEYKSFSQFGGNGSYFKLFTSIVHACKKEQSNDISAGIHSNMHSLVYGCIYDTILHEYAHVIFEFFKMRDTKMEKFILDEFAHEENFAEEFQRWVNDEAMSEYHKTFPIIIKKWKKSLTGMN